MKKIKYLILIISIISLVTIFYIKFFSKDISIKPFGIQVFTVQSNSMEPIFNRGDIIIIKEENEYKEGDIVTYELNDNEFITHRIIEKNDNVYRTKGDNNNTKDEEEIKKENILGKVVSVFHLP